MGIVGSRLRRLRIGGFNTASFAGAVWALRSSGIGEP